ncbi:dynamin family protein [Streptomyces sp. NPDC019890]|uniref:dynamin family protein n=1 Tax=Streptomyces sp. NPDC019890 TaxID=3365064 RepID=UPI00384C9C55
MDSIENRDGSAHAPEGLTASASPEDGEDSRFEPGCLRTESLVLLQRTYDLARGAQESGAEETAFQADVRELSSRWERDVPLVLLLGSFSSGKTSLLARLLDLDWLPVSKTATTAVPTEFRFGPELRGELWFRTTVPFTAVPAAGHRGPQGSQAMTHELLTWLRDPYAFGIREVHEVTSGDRMPVRPRELADELTAATQSAVKPGTVRSFEVSLHPRQPKVFDLTDPGEFARHLTEPGLALTLSKAVCEVPHPRLRHLTFLDSAGLCAPAWFHADVMDELRYRKPDGVVVLLDARRPVSPMNTAALEALRLLVRTPADYQRVLFGFSWWDHALRRFMKGEDHSSGPPRDFGSSVERQAATAERLPAVHDRLKGAVADAVSVPVSGDLTVIPLALGPVPPAEMHSGPADLCRRLESEFAGRLGVRMWADRWRGAGDPGRLLSTAHKNVTDEVRRRLHLLSDDTDREWEAQRIAREQAQLRTAVARATRQLTEIVLSQERTMHTQIAGLRRRKDLLEHIDSGYDRAATTAAAALSEAATAQARAISHFYPDVSALRPVSVDAQLLRLDKATRDRIRDLLSGADYWLKATSDAFFDSIVDLTADDREAARAVFRNQLRTTAGVLTEAAHAWSIRARILEDQTMAELRARSDALAAGQQETKRLREELRQRLAVLLELEPHVRELARDIDAFTQKLAARNDMASPVVPD